MGWERVGKPRADVEFHVRKVTWREDLIMEKGK